MRTRPLPGLCAAFAAGILLASFSSWAIWCLATFGILWIGISVARGRNTHLWLTLLTIAAWLGAVRCTMSLAIPENDVSRLPSTSLTLYGTADDAIRIDDDPHTDEAADARFILNATSVRLDTDPGGRNSSGRQVSGRVAVRMSLRSAITGASTPRRLLPAGGDVVELRGRLERPDGPRNPGGFDYRGYLARQSITATLIVSQPERMRIVRRERWRNPFRAAAQAMRQRVLDACKEMLPQPVEGVLAGILIGDRHRISLPIQEEFERTGTTHILATAGLHVGIAVCVLTWLLRRCHVPRRPAVAAAIVALMLYAIMAGERAAVLRAAIVAGTYLAGELLEREPNFPNALALAAGALLLFNPLELFDPGFQLSFATVITIVLVMPIFTRLHARIGQAVRGESVVANACRFAVQSLAMLGLLSLAAQIGAGPLVAYYFYNLSLVSVAANVLVVPVMFPILGTGLAMPLLWSIDPRLAAPAAFLLRGLLGYVIWIVHLFSAAPFASRNIAQPSFWLIHGYYGFVWGLAWSARDLARKENRTEDVLKRRVVRRVAFVMGAAAIALGVWGFVSPRPRELRVTFLDVGQGDACVLESPGGKVVIVDTGGLILDGEDDLGRRVVAPYLRYRGISIVDAMVLTHPHADHIGGASSLLRRFPTIQLMDDGRADGSPLVPRMLGQAQSAGAQIVIGRRGQTLDFGDGVTAEVLGPSEALAGEGPNNASVVLRVRFGRTAFLLTGDAEAPEEAEMVTAGQDLSCDVLKVGHHGSRTSSTPELISAAHPKFAVISVGKRNLYGHPNQEVINRLQDSGARVYRTDRDGAVICHSDGGTVRVETMLH